MNPSQPELAAHFSTYRYALWGSLITADEAARLHTYALKRAASGAIAPHALDRTLSAGGDFIMDGLLADLAPRVERAIGLSLWPTYSYFRVYRAGDVLDKHTDRPACEISLTLCLGFTAPRTWPIWIDGPLGLVCCELSPGDALLYRGIECPHWRDAFAGESAVQVFLHYVDRDGPHAEWKFDKRASLAPFPFSAAPNGRR